ncbi:PAS domain-containing sensor histidine kinase [Abyssisolibacter fermentans]|uniref:sensor histidine kinase n=1 Tax=Abyssisolibacter fermentans TaxID=1766203 RepID=UPI00082FFB4A|nr:PAS domain-containing sensor histidine kinase [Abyssisolibacter fermentans]
MLKITVNLIKKLFFIFVVFNILFVSKSFVFAIDEKKNILIINSCSTNCDYKMNNIINYMQSDLCNDKYNILIENMSLKKIDKEKYCKIFQEIYKNHDIKFVVTNDNESFDFFNKYEKEFFKDAHCIALKNDFSDTSNQFTSDKTTYVISKYTINSLLGIINRLHPYKDTIVIIVDDNMNSLIYKEFMKKIHTNNTNKKFVILNNTNINTIKKTIESLNENCVLLYCGAIKKNEKEYNRLSKGLDMLNQFIDIPTYSIFPRFIGNGVVGGERSSFEDEAKSVCDIIDKVSIGEDIPNIIYSKMDKVFDYTMLEKYEISTYILPQGSVIINDEPRFYTIHKTSVFCFFIFIIIVLTIIIMILLESIQKQKISDEALKNSEELNRKIVNLLPDGVLIYDRKKILYSNKSGLKLLGAKSMDQLAQYDMRKFFDIDDEGFISSNLKEYLSNEHIISYMLEHKLIRLDGEEIHVESNILKFDMNNEKTVLVFFRDVTELKKAESLKKRIEFEEKLRKEAIEYDKLKTEFFANISHELRTPLNLIFSSIQLIDVINKENEKLIKPIQIVKQNCFRLLKLVNNLIDITKMDSGYYEAELQNIDIVNTIEDIVLSVADYVKSKNISLIFDTDIEERVIACDPNIIERVMLNLLSNAIKFTDLGGDISVNLYNKNDKIIVSVKDTGIGIPNDKINKIFKRFRQVDKTFTRNHEGSGIGLSLVKSLIEMQGGNIKVDSVFGEGSCFTFELPVSIIKNKGINRDDDRTNRYIEKMQIEFSDIYKDDLY